VGTCRGERVTSHLCKQIQGIQRKTMLSRIMPCSTGTHTHTNSQQQEKNNSPQALAQCLLSPHTKDFTGCGTTGHWQNINYKARKKLQWKGSSKWQTENVAADHACVGRRHFTHRAMGRADGLSTCGIHRTSTHRAKQLPLKPIPPSPHQPLSMSGCHWRTSWERHSC